MAIGNDAPNWDRSPLDWSNKGFPAQVEGMTIEEIVRQEWNLFEDGFVMPVAVLKESAVEHNLEQLASYCKQKGVLLAPHGKMTMSPDLWQRQLGHGAWAITVAVPHHVKVCRAVGIRRVLLANELVDVAALQWLAGEFAADAEFEMYCYADSIEGVAIMDREMAATAGRLRVLVEVGALGGRTGCRTVENALEVATAVAQSSSLTLAGIAGFEGPVGEDRKPETVTAVNAYLGHIADVYAAAADLGVFGEDGDIILSAGGSELFDLVVESFRRAVEADPRVRIVLRSGAYLAHDSGHYDAVTPSKTDSWPGKPFIPAMEIWGMVLSRPEPPLALLNFGRRDAGFDVGWPRPHLLRRRGRHDLEPAEGLEVFSMDDQHAYVRVGQGVEISVGDLVGCGISHPCTNFDKWRLIPLVDDDYTFVGAVRTFF